MKNNEIYNLEILKSAKNKYFSLENFYKNQPNEKILRNLAINIFNFPKNVGKTYELIQQTNKSTQNIINSYKNNTYDSCNDRFVLLFLNETILKARINEINNDNQYKYYVRGNKIFSKGYLSENEKGENVWLNRNILVGYALPLMTIGNFSSFQFNGFKTCWWDEYRSKIALSKDELNRCFNNFLTFIDNFQRSKENVKFYLFGNNEPGPDVIAEGFEIDKQQDTFVWIDESIGYFNVGNAYLGLPENTRLAKKFARFNKSFNDFINENKAMESIKALCSKKEYDNAHHWGFIVQELMFYEIKVYRDIFYISSIEESEWLNRKNNSVNLGVLNIDTAHDILINPIQEDIVYMFKNLFQTNKLLFWKVKDKLNFEKMWTQFLGRIDIDKEIKNS